MPLERSDWTKIKTILCDASKVPADKRDEFVAESCAGNEELQRTVDRLLSAGAIESALDRFALCDYAEIIAAEDPNSLVGRRVGGYHIERWITSGGMSDVYAVTRPDETSRQTYALKLFRRDRNRTELLRRFRIEHHSLEKLQHPNIAQLHDTGIDDDGSPFLVMELVHGKRIDVYCDEYALSIPERLELFRQVCEAVHFAHRHLVIHRDLKPSNVLVSDDGTPKLLDFGIAKIIQSTTGSVDETMTGVPSPMTPQYASPEQMRCETVTTATDVYALGLLLYELLTGSPAQLRRNSDTDTMEKIICHRDPVPPSELPPQGRFTTGTQVVSRRSAHAIDRDLDNIVLMALRKDPGRRYASVQQLSDDIGRFFSGLPVIAQPDTLSYRTSKFVKRHRVAVLSGTALAAGLVFGLIGTFWQANVARNERDAQRALRQEAEENLERARVAEARAKQSAETADKVSEFLVGLFKAANPSERRGNPIAIEEVVNRGADTVTEELATQPTIQASLLHTLGSVYYNLGLHDRSASLIEQAVTLRRSSSASDNVSLAKSLQALGAVYVELDKLDEAESMLREACALRANDAEGEVVGQADALNNLALALLYKGQYAKAEPLYLEALALYKSTNGQEESGEACIYSNLAVLELERGRLDKAEEYTRASLAIERRILPPDSPDLVPAMMSLAILVGRKGDFEQAESLMREVTDLALRVLGGEHTLTMGCKNNLAELARSVGRLEEAERLHREILDSRIRVFGREHRSVATSFNNLAATLYDQERYREAVATYDEAMPIVRSTMKGHPDKICLTLLGFITSSTEIGEYEQAVQLLEEARTVASSIDPPIPGNAARLSACEGRLKMLMENEVEGRELLSDAHEELARILGHHDRDVKRVGSWLGKSDNTVSASPPR